jgi:hypothetical protein
MHIYARAKHINDFGFPATKIGLLMPSALKTSISEFI